MDVAPLPSFGSKFRKVIQRTRHRSSKNGVPWIASVGFSVLYRAFQIKCIFNHQLTTVILMGFSLWILDPPPPTQRCCEIVPYSRKPDQCKALQPVLCITWMGYCGHVAIVTNACWFLCLHQHIRIPGLVCTPLSERTSDVPRRYLSAFEKRF